MPLVVNLFIADEFYIQKVAHEANYILTNYCLPLH